MTTVLGGEMLNWSDRDGAHGAALVPLVRAATGDTLVAGPHAAALVDALPPGPVTVLVRGVADAEKLTARFAGRGGVTVWCGSLEKVAAVPAYDTVVALDGLDRLRSAEADDAPWDETLAQLVALLRPGGWLLLGVENLFGLHRLVALPPARTDADWVVAGEHDPARPAGPAALAGRLAEAGLAVERSYAAYPAVGGATVLLGPELARAEELAGFVSAALASACAGAVGALADPVRLTAGAVRHGLVAELAPGWVVLARRLPAPDSVPGAVLTGLPGAAPGAVSTGLPGAVPGAVSTGLPGAVSGAVPTGLPTAFSMPAAVVGGREIRLPDDELPRGRTLASVLLAACDRRDLPALRDLLGRWLAGPAAGVPADQVVATPGGNLTGLASAGPPLAALRRFAADVIRGGHADLWPGPADEADLTALLAGMTGREVDPADVPAAEPAPDTLREAVMARDRLARELAEARARHEWYEETLRAREAELRRIRQINAVLTATVPGRAAKALARRLRAVRSAVRRPGADRAGR